MKDKQDWITNIGALLLISTALYYLYYWFNVLLDFQEIFGHNVRFGYSFSTEWAILNIVFWISTIVGFWMLIKQMKIGVTLINGTLLCLLTYLGVDLISTQSVFVIIVQIILIASYLLFYNYKNNFKIKDSLSSLAVYLLFGILFLTINQH